MASSDCWRGKWALVTGASSGIGSALAEELASGGAHLVLTARRRQRLTQLRKRLRTAHSVQVEVVAADLDQPDAPEKIFAFTNKRGIQVDLLVNNAGVGSYGEFRASDRPRELGIVQVNCSAVVHLTHLYLPGMVERRSGDILIVASTGAYQGVPYMATYAASKAFDLLFAEALAEEVKRYGVRVCALCPGPTVSEFQKVAGVPEQMAAGMEERADQVAGAGGGGAFGNFGVHQLARRGGSTDRSAAVCHIRGRETVSSSAARLRRLRALSQKHGAWTEVFIGSLNTLTILATNGSLSIGADVGHQSWPQPPF
jgi:short-subunit dehydrogenase